MTACLNARQSQRRSCLSGRAGDHRGRRADAGGAGVRCGLRAVGGRCRRSLRQMDVPRVFAFSAGIAIDARQGSHNFDPNLPSMTAPSVTPWQVRCALLLRDEIALLDIRHEAAFATGHPLFAANMAAGRIALEAETRLPRKDVPVVIYDAGEGLVPQAVDRLQALGYADIRQIDGGLQAWRDAGYELFQDVNSYAKAFGELVESRRHTPSLPADAVAYAGAVRRLGVADAVAREAETRRTLYRFDVRDAEEYAAGHIAGFRHYPGGQLVQEIDMAAPVRGARLLLTDDRGVRADMTASSLAQMGWETHVLDGGYDPQLEARRPLI